MNLERQRLIKILGVVGTASGNKVMKVSDYVHFSVDRENNRLFISCSDFNAFMTMEYGDLSMTTIDDVEDVFLVEHRKLLAILKASTTEQVGLESHGTQLAVETDGSYKLQVWSTPEEFPAADFTFTEVQRWAVPELQSAWNRAAVAVSKDVTKMNYQGVNYDGNFAATDNRRLAVVRGTTEYDGDSMLLPPIFGNVIKHCKNEVRIGPNSKGNMLVVVCDEIGLLASVRLLDAQFQNYRGLMDSRAEGTRVVVDKNKLLGACSRLSVFTDDMYQLLRVSLVCADGDVSLCLSIAKDGEGNEDIEVDEINIDNPEPGVIADYRYHLDNVMEGVSALGDPDTVSLEFTEPGFMWVDEEQFTYLLTPIVD